jgi:hypothetical protein
MIAMYMKNNSSKLISIKPLLFKICMCALVAICVYVCGMQCSIAKNKLFYYEPEVTDIEGTAVTKTVNGHCDIDNDEYEPKDLKETCAFLILDEPIDVVIPTRHFKTHTDPKRDKPEKNIEILQIQLSNTGNVGFDFKTGDRVHVQGTLFRHFTKCHHTRVLIDPTDDIKKIDH